MNLVTNSTQPSGPILPVHPVYSPGLHPLPGYGPLAPSPVGAVAGPSRRALNEREKQVLRLVCEGMSNAEIATRLGVSRDSIKTELKRIFHKISVKNRTQAAVLVIKQSML